MPTPSEYDWLPASLREHEHADAVRRVVESALDAVAPGACVRRHLARDGDALTIDGRRVPLPEGGRVRIFGAGKASLGLTRALLDLLGDRIADGLVIAKHADVDAVGPVQVRTGGHPLPNEASLAATEEMLELLADGRPDDLILSPISGGASALACAPRALDLAQVRERTRALIASGDPIHLINEQRRSWDAIKAGGLARAAAPARVVGLVLSDVVGDPLRFIGSGPTVLDSPDPRVLNVIVGRNRDALEAAATTAKAAGLAVGEHREPLTGEARELGRRLGRVLAHAGDGFPVARPGVLLAGGETTVHVRGTGRGGRNQELALGAIAALDGARDTWLVALGTDGEDGPTPAAGALVTGESAARARALELDAIDHLERNDAYTFFERMGDLLVTGPTGTNVGDLALGFVF